VTEGDDGGGWWKCRRLLRFACEQHVPVHCQYAGGKECQTDQMAETQPNRPPTPSTPKYRLLPSDHTISRTSVRMPSGTAGIPRPFTSSLRRLRTSTQSFITSSTSDAVPGSGGGIEEKGTAGVM